MNHAADEVHADAGPADPLHDAADGEVFASHGGHVLVFEQGARRDLLISGTSRIGTDLSVRKVQQELPGLACVRLHILQRCCDCRFQVFAGVLVSSFQGGPKLSVHQDLIAEIRLIKSCRLVARKFVLNGRDMSLREISLHPQPSGCVAGLTGLLDCLGDEVHNFGQALPQDGKDVLHALSSRFAAAPRVSYRVPQSLEKSLVAFESVGQSCSRRCLSGFGRTRIASGGVKSRASS